MSWTERLNDALPRVRLGTATVDIHEWAHTDQPKDGPPHRHSYFVICRIEAGEGEYTAAGRSHHVGPGDLLIARPGVRHMTVGAEGFRMSWVSFEVPARQSGGDDEAGLVLQGFLCADSVVVKDPGVAGVLWEMLKEEAHGPRTPGQKAVLAALAPALLLSLARAGGGEGGGRARRNGMTAESEARGDGVAAESEARGDGVAAESEARGEGAAAEDDARRDGFALPDDNGGAPATEGAPDRHLRAVRMAVRYIEDNLDRPLRVEELAKQVNVSPRQLTRLFATVLNEPPASYVERVRLEYAAGLLERTRTPIKQIAAELGYPDVPTFTRAFTRQHQSPPGRFRRARLNDVNGDRG